MTLRRSLTLLTLGTLALVACADPSAGSSTGTDPEALVGHEWTLDASSMASLADEVPAGTITLTFSAINSAANAGRRARSLLADRCSIA